MQATGYARLGPWQARTVLAVWALGAAFFATLAPSRPGPQTVPQAPANRQDIELYRAEVVRIRGGQGYYQAAAAELSARGYPTLSVFNWRTPLSFWLLAALPEIEDGRRMLQFLALLVLLVSCAALGRDERGNTARTLFHRRRPSSPTSLPQAGEKSPVTFPAKGETGLVTFAARSKVRLATASETLALLFLLIGALLPCTLKDMMFLPDAWSAVLLALSATAYGTGWNVAGVGAGLASLGFRELALPYCVLAAGLACRHRRPREATAWVAGILLWGLFFMWHAHQVAHVIPPGGHAHKESWIQFGGTVFVLSTLRMHAYLFVLPGWVTGLFFAAALLGLAGWQTDWGQRIGLSVCLYVAAFALVGQEFNHYWGILVAPLYPFGVVRFPASVRDLFGAALVREGRIASPAT